MFSVSSVVQFRSVDNLSIADEDLVMAAAEEEPEEAAKEAAFEDAEEITKKLGAELVEETEEQG